MGRISSRLIAVVLAACLVGIPSVASANGAFSATTYSSTFNCYTTVTVDYVADYYQNVRVSKVTGTWKFYGTSRGSITKASYGAYEQGIVGGAYNTGTWKWTAYNTYLTKTVYSSYTQYKGSAYFSLPWVYTAGTVAPKLGGSAKGLIYYDTPTNPGVLSSTAYFGGPW